MYFDDSHTEAKVTDVTHCDLETKSILKPPKTRAPLQEVDLGNHTTVEFDVIRKRRVSFAGVNRIKEFNSEAKSFSICSTPAYEEKVSTSSDSSALSTSVSVNINSLSKENDITILDDTMDLTDLSIVQLSAMDITGLKPQKPSQGVPDIFAPRSQDSGLFSSQQGINRPMFSYEINKPNVKETSPSQSEPEKSNKPEDTPLALDPRQMLLKELLEESAVDCSVDNYLKANTLFAQNNYNVGESCKTEIKKPFEVSEMDFTQALVDPIKPESHHFQPVLEKKDFDNEQIHAKITSCKPSDVSGVNMDQSILQNIVLTGNECPKPLQNLKQSHTFPNFISDESKTTKIDASQMEFTEALPSKNFNLAQKNLVASNYIADRLLARPNISTTEQLNLAKNLMKSNTNLNLNSNESRLGNSNISQMEFTEALPSKNIVKQDLVSNIHSTGSLLQNMQTKPFQNLMPNHMLHNFNVDESKSGYNNASQMEFTEALPTKNTGHQNFIGHASSSVLQMKHPKLVQSHSFPNFNSDESRLENSNVSQMEFTEALPPKHVVHQNLVYHTSSSVSQIEQPKQLSKHTVPNFNLNESRLESNNVSQMEFTEALPSKNTDCQNFIDHTSSSVSQIEHEKQFPKSMPSHRIPNFNIGESRSGNSNLSQMEFTEALPTKNIGGQHFIDHTKSSVTQMELPKQIPKAIPNHLIPNFNLDESRVRNCNTSQMEFTEALPSKNIAYSNFKIDGSEKVKDNNTTLMELTEALPPRNANPDFNNIVASDSIKDGLLERDNRSPLMPLKPSCNEIRNCMIPNLNTDLSKAITCNDAIEGDLIEGLSAKPSHNNIIASNYVGDLEEKRNISPFMPEKPPLHDIQSYIFLNLNNELFKEMNKNNVPKNESQEVPPSLPVDIGPNEVLNNMIEVPKVSQIVHPNPSPNLNIDKSISPENNNASQMEFTEVLPSKKMPLSNNVTNQFAENKLLAHTDVFQIEDPKIDLNSEKGNYVNRTDRFSEKLGETSQMELTEAVPMLYINKKQTISARNSLGIHRNVSQKNVIDRENIPPCQDLNESNSMDVTDLNFVDSENIMHASESNAKINMNTGNFSDMEFTQGLPASMNDGKTGQKKLDHNELEKNNALISQKLPGKNVSSAIHNEQNVPNTMNITVIDQPDIEEQIKENENVNRLIMQPTFNLEHSISKDISQMEFTEALPARNIPATLNFARSAMNLDCEPSVETKFSPSYNLQTSNMEFTEVLPITKQSTITSKGTPESDKILQNKIIPSKYNPNDSCSMDITDIENVSDHNDIFKNSKECSENPDKNKVNIISTDFSNVPKSETNKKLDDEHKSSPNFLFLSGSKNNFVTERKMLGEMQSNFSQLEFTEALPVRNEPNTLKTENDIFSNENPFVNNKKSIMVSDENYSDSNTITQFREFPQKSVAQHFIFASEDKENEVTFPSNKENVDNLYSDVTGAKKISQESSHVNDELAIQKNVLVDKSEFLHDSGHKNFNLLSKPYENMFPVANQFVNSSVDNTQMDFTEAVQPQIKFKDITKLNADDIVVSEKRSCVLVDSDLDANKIPDASQMEFTEAITMPKCKSDLYQNVADSKFTNDSSVENSKAGTSEAKELLQPIVEKKLDFLPLASSNIPGNISSNEEEQEAKDSISEEVKIADIDIQNSEGSNLKCSEEESIVNNCPKIFQSYDKINKNSITTIAHTIPSSDTGNSRELNNLNKVRTEPVSSAQNVEVFSPMHVDEPSIPTIRKDNKVDSLRKLFEKESKSDNSRGEIFTPKGKQFCAVRLTDGTSESSNNFRSASKTVETLTVDDASQRKNLVHFSTPPVRIPKRRKTFGFPDSEESVQLLQSSTSDLALPLQDVSSASNLQNASQRRGIFDENRKSAYDPEKGKEEWNRLVKNDAFMKERSFHFINPCKWKYEFRWPMVLVLEIPDIEVNENSRKKNISLVSNISDSDHISVFIDNRMKKNMSLILSEKWLNSHCKTIKDLLFTIKFIEEEYNKLEPLISSMKYFYQEFPFDFSSDRIIFKIVNLRKEFCFEIKIDVSYGQVKGKNIDVINHVGEISKTKVQQLFDRLQPNTERFYLFWQKLMEIQ